MTNELLIKIKSQTAGYHHPDDAKEVERVALLIEAAQLDRHAYFAVLDDWKQAYAAYSKSCREAKAEGKVGTDIERSNANSNRQQLRYALRSMMTIRNALKVVARRHWERQKAASAA